MRHDITSSSSLLSAYVDPLSKHLQENHGYDADYHSDSDNSSYVPGSSATINTIDVSYCLEGRR